MFVRLAIFVCILSFSFLSHSQDSLCPSIDCDCESLNNLTWRKSCRDHEKEIKEICVENQGVPRNYCALHGPAATPLPLLTKPIDVGLVPVDELNLADRTVASIFWAVRFDIKMVERYLNDADYDRATDMLRFTELNLESLFAKQLQVTKTLVSIGEHAKAQQRWGEYAEDNSAMAEANFEIADTWWLEFESAVSESQRKAYRLAALSLYRISGLGREQAALAYGYSGKHKLAAEQWRDASATSDRLLSLTEQTSKDPKAINYLRYQSAARLQRMSYHWSLLKNPG